MTTSTDYSCRRRAARYPLPVEIEISHAEQRLAAIVRDVSTDGESECGFIGIGILHRTQLPLRTPLRCRTDASGPLPSGILTLTWTQSFGPDGYLSGGRLVRYALQEAGERHEEVAG